MALLSLEIAELFAERFPRYGLLLCEWNECARLDGFQEKFDQQEISIPRQTEVLYLYGISGPLSSEIWEWLKEDPSRRLVFLEPSTSHIIRFLQMELAREILECRQIEIVHLPPRELLGKVLQELAEAYPVRGVQVELFLPYDRRKFQRVKISLLRKTGFAHAHYLDRLHGHIPFAHLLKNLRRIPDAFYANGLKGAFSGVPAIVCGAGPSLMASLETLRGLEDRALILAGGSAIAVLSHHGIVPHFCLAIDPNPDELARLKNSFAFEVPFLFSTRLIPEAFATCNGPFGYLRTGMAGIPELWFDEQLGLNDPILGEKLPPEALSVTALSAAFAHHLGCNPIIFDGVDLAYTENRRYADGVFAKDSEEECLQPIDRELLKRSKEGKAVQSAVRWVMEASALSRFARRCKGRRWINCTRGGLGLKGVEEMPLSEVPFSQEWDLRSKIHCAILKSPMPENARSILEEKVNELKESLQAVLAHLEVMIHEKSFGLRALAELELKEELAYAILLFDAEKTIRIALGCVDDYAFWKAVQELAKRYHDALCKF